MDFPILYMKMRLGHKMLHDVIGGHQTYIHEKIDLYTVFTNGGHAGKNWCLVMKARRWRMNKNCK